MRATDKVKRTSDARGVASVDENPTMRCMKVYTERVAQIRFSIRARVQFNLLVQLNS